MIINHNLSTRMIIKTSIVEYKKWFLDARMLLLPVLLIYLYNYITVPLLNNASEFGDKLNVVEPYIAMLNSGSILLIVPIFFFLLIADFPKIDNNTVWYILRIGRLNWILAQILKLIMMAWSYILILFFGMTVPMIKTGKFSINWSDVATKYLSKFPEKNGSFALELLPANMYHNLKLMEILFKSTIAMVAIIQLIGLTLLFCSIMNKKAVGFIICGVLVSGGAMLSSIKSSAMWFFPVAHSIVWLHYDGYFSKPIVSEIISLCYYLVLFLILLLLNIYCIKNFNYDKINQL